MRKLLAYSLCIGMAFVDAYPSHAEYPDGKVLLERLGVEIDEDGEPVADETGGCWPKVYDALKIRGSEKLTALCGDKTALKEGRWDSRCISNTDFNTYNSIGIIPNKAVFDRIGDLVRSREFLTMIFGEGFVSEFETVAESSEKVYTDLISRIDSQVCEKLQAWEDGLAIQRKMDEDEEGFCEGLQALENAPEVRRKMDEDEDEEDLKSKYSKWEKKIKSQIAECKNVLKDWVLREMKYRFLWENWKVFDKISYNSDQKKVLLAGRSFLRALKHVPDLQNYDNPVRIAFLKVQDLWPEYLTFCSRHKNLIEKWEEEEKEKEKEEEARNEIRKKLLSEEYRKLLSEEYRKHWFKEYRKRFGSIVALYNQSFLMGEGDAPVITVNGESFGILTLYDEQLCPMSTEPVITVDIQICQRHFEDKNGARKLYDKNWKRRDDLNIELRLIIDTRTKELLSAFCREKFIVNGQIITDFGSDGLCVFESEQLQGFAEEKK